MVLLCAGIALALVSAPQEPLKQAGELKSVSGARYVGAGQRVDYTVNFIFREVKANTTPQFGCENRCRGNKHLLHEECDSSCDEACKAIHQDTARAIPFRKAGLNMQPFSSLSGRGVSMTLDALASAVRTEAERQPHQSYKFQHWNQTPCSNQWRLPKYNIYNAVAHVKILEEVKGEAGGVAGTRTLNEFDIQIGELHVPTAEFEDGSPEVACACSVVQEIKPDGTYTSPPASEPPPRPVTGGASTPPVSTYDPLEVGSGDGRRASLFDLGIYAGGAYSTDWFNVPEENEQEPVEYVRVCDAFGAGYFYIPGTETALKIGGYVRNPFGDNVAEQFGLDPQLDDMTGGVLTGSNPFPVPYNIFLPAGTTFDTDANGVQDCVLVADATLSMPPPPPPPPLDWLLASIDPNTQKPRGPKASVKLRVMCLEMQKKEPTPATKFKIKPPKDEVLARIGKQISKSRFRGPWDQAKVWAYTDGATLKDVQDKLLPAPRKGAYARALFELAQAGVDFRQPKFAKLPEPALLTEFGSERATFWLARQVTADPKRLDAWSKSGASEMAALLESGEQTDLVHFARVVHVLAMSSEPAGQRAAIAILNGVPEASRGKIKDVMMPVWLLSLSTDKAIAGEALKLMDSYKPEAAEVVRLNLK